MEAACSDKQTILKTLQSLPEDATIEDAMERLYLLLKVKTGCDQADSGQTVSHAEAETRVQKWPRGVVGQLLLPRLPSTRCSRRWLGQPLPPRSAPRPWTSRAAAAAAAAAG